MRQPERVLGYSSNLHAAEGVDDLALVLSTFAAQARETLGWRRLGIDLRLGSIAIAELRDAAKLADLRRALDQSGLVAHTLNGFPLGRFQDAVVKQGAYRPDWTSDERVADSIALIGIALALSDASVVSVSTVPGSYRPFGAEANDPIRIAANLGRWAAAAARAARDGKRRVVLALEPEPWCLLENSFDVAAFWRGPLAEHGVAACAADLDGDLGAARDAVADHLGICFDTCHISLAFEDQAAAVARMTDAGAGIAKIQVSAAPEVIRPDEDPTGVAELKALAEPRFLHQTAASSHAGSIVKVEDLDQLDACLARLPGAHAVRSHFHIPLFRAPRTTGLSSTIEDSVTGLRAALAANPAAHLSVETYTWSVLAEDQRDALAGTVRELDFLHGAVAGLGVGAR